MKIKSPSKKTLIIVVVAVVAVGLAGLFALKQHNDRQVSAPQDKGVKDEQKIDFAKPNQNTDNKDDVNDGTGSDRPLPPTEKDPETQKLVVEPIVARFGKEGDKLVFAGGVNSIVENGGKCTYLLSWNGGQKTVEVEAHADPSSTSCVIGQIGLGELPADQDIELELRYLSAGYQGVSKNNPKFKVGDLR